MGTALSGNPTVEPLNSPGSGWLSHSVGRGHLLYQERMDAEQVIRITSGMVKLVKRLANGHDRITGLLSGGAVLGMAPHRYAGNARYAHSAIAVTLLHFESAPWLHMSRLRETGAQQYVDLLESHCDGFQRVERWIAELTGDTVRCRVARLLCYLAELQGCGPHGEIELLSVKEASQVLGVSLSATSRVLAQFKRSGILRSVADRRYRFDPCSVSGLTLGNTTHLI